MDKLKLSAYEIIEVRKIADISAKAYNTGKEAVTI